MSYIGPTALNALWTKLVALLAAKADRASVYSKAEINYIIATHDWTGVSDGTGSGGTRSLSKGGSSGEDETYVHIEGTETITGVKTFYSGGLRISSKSYNATLENQTEADTTVYMPTNTGKEQYLLSRQDSATVANTVPYYTGTDGAMGTKTIATSTLSESSNEIPTSAAIIAYLRSQGLIPQQQR